MRQYLILLFSLLFFSANSQVCAELSNWSLTTDNGNGTCSYSVSIIVSSNNGAKGTAAFSIGGTTVYSESNCICNPTTITFPITVNCGSSVTIDVAYDAPGNGNDCFGSTGSIVLPIEWVSFDVEKDGTTNSIQWSVYESEVNKYNIQKSFDGFNFRTIGEQESQGISSHQVYYSYEDDQPYSGQNYYRIQQIGNDLSYSYSKIVSVQNSPIRDISIFPNPFHDKINLKLDRFESWRLMDVFGNIILSGNEQEIQTENLVAGMYFVQVLENNNINHIETLVKQ